MINEGAADDVSADGAPASGVAGSPDLPQAFADWVGPHLSLITAVAAREVGRADADDLVQEALLRAWRRRSTFDATKGSVRVWLLAVLLDRARRHRVRGLARMGWHRVPQQVDDSPVRSDATGHAGSDQRLDVDAALRRLPRRQRQVITLHYLADLTVTDVAHVLGISVGTVKSQLFDARKALRGTLEDR